MGEHFIKKKRKYKLTPLSISLIALAGLIVISTIFTIVAISAHSIIRKNQIHTQTVALGKAKNERLESERLWKIERDEQIEKEQQEREAYQKKWDEAYRVSAEKLEKARLAKIKAEKERAERAAKAEQARLAAIRKERQRAAEEKARLLAEKKERWRISGLIKAQQARLSAEQAEYNSLNPEAIVNLPVENIFQNPELPNGCEITSLAIVVNFLGHYVDKCTLSDEFLPQKEFRDINKKRVCADPNSVYCGNPRYTSGGYYCFAPPLVQAANSFLSSVESTYRAIDITGSDESALLTQLGSGRPVIAFTTLSMGDPYTYEPSKWIIEGTGTTHIPFLNLHCVVLYGYDDQFIYIADPLKGKIQCKRSSFIDSYTKIGSRAIVLAEQ